MVKEIKTSKGTWKIHYGLYFNPSNSTFENLKKAIESSSLRESYLKIITEHRGHILVDRTSKEIHFLSF